MKGLAFTETFGRSRCGVRSPSHSYVILLLAVLSLCSGAYASDWATGVTSWHNLGDDPYDDPLSVLGKPTTLILEPGFPPVQPGVFHCSMV